MFRHKLDIDYIDNKPHLRLDGFDPILITEEVAENLKDLIIEILEEGMRQERAVINEYIMKIAQDNQHSGHAQVVLMDLSDMIRKHIE